MADETKFLLDKLLGLFGDNLISIILFGSRARKNYHEDSDLDLLVILKKDTNNSIAKLRKDFLLKYRKRLDLHIFTEKETIENFADYSPLFVTLLLGKKILFDRRMFFEEQFEKFIKKIAEINVKYCEGDKIWEMKKIAKNLRLLH